MVKEERGKAIFFFVTGGLGECRCLCWTGEGGSGLTPVDSYTTSTQFYRSSLPMAGSRFSVVSEARVFFASFSYADLESSQLLSSPSLAAASTKRKI